MVDVAILVALAAGAFAGWRKGFIVPLVVQAGALLSLGALYAGPLRSTVPSGISGIGMGVGAVVLASSLLGAVSGMLIRLVYRFGALQKLDKVAGVPLGAATAAVTLYVALVGTIALDGWLSPLHSGLAIGPQQLAAVQALAATNPALATFADPSMLNEVTAVAAKAPIPADQLAKYDAALGFYESSLRPALLSSKIAPALLALGEHLPVVGQHVVFPTK
ncbi:MAG TPA: hypothetical protein VGT60_04660 [Candidatus Limnocylindria bacterium]|nr:hypothetical protein [Candidatus Limnocylindria bacterium]